MAAGKYRHKIKLLAPQVPSINDAGEATTATRQAWQTHADVTPQSAREIVRNGLTESQITYVFEMRYRSDINAQWQIEYDGRRFAISQCLNPDQRKIENHVIGTEIK